MDRLVTDNPDGNFQTMMNLAYAKDGEVWLRGGKNGDVKLYEVLAKSCSDFCDPPNENFAEAYTDCLTGYDDVCAVALLFAVATQAAEMRGRLQDYEDLGTVEELAALKEQTRWVPVSEGLPNNKQRVIVRCANCPTVIGWRMFDAWYTDFGCAYSEPQVTYWMPLPPNASKEA